MAAVKRRPPVRAPEAARPPCTAPTITRVRADALEVGNRVIHEGRTLTVIQVEHRARVELLTQGLNQRSGGLVLKLRDGTLMDRVGA